MSPSFRSIPGGWWLCRRRSGWHADCPDLRAIVDVREEAPGRAYRRFTLWLRSRSVTAAPTTAGNDRARSGGSRAPGRPAAIAESERLSPCCPDRSADARSDGHVLGPGGLTTGERLAAPEADAGSPVPSAMTAARPAPGESAGRAPGLAASTPAPGYFKMLTARATISATVTIETTDCKVMASLAHRDSGITSAGLNAAALVKARYR